MGLIKPILGNTSPDTLASAALLLTTILLIRLMSPSVLNQWSDPLSIEANHTHTTPYVLLKVEKTITNDFRFWYTL